MINLFSLKGTTTNPEDATHQEAATKEAVTHAGAYALFALASSATLVLGAARLFPKFERSLSVSSKTALIVTPAFGTFFLLSEFKMNDRKRERAAAARAAAAEIRARGY